MMKISRLVVAGLLLLMLLAVSALAQETPRLRPSAMLSTINEGEVQVSGRVHSVNSASAATASGERTLILFIDSYRLPDGRTYYFRSPWSTTIFFGNYTIFLWTTGEAASAADLQPAVYVFVTGRNPSGTTNVTAREIVLLHPDDVAPATEADEEMSAGTEEAKGESTVQAPVTAPPPTTRKWPCSGTYPGEVTQIGRRMTVVLAKVETYRLDSYASVMPHTGGNRVFVYFDTDPARGAEYCLFIYRDNWTLRRVSTSPGWFNVEVGRGDVEPLQANSATGVSVTFDAELIEADIERCWNFHMGHVKENSAVKK